MEIAGVVVWVVAGVLFWLSRRAAGQLAEMAGTETFTAASLQETAGAVAKEIGAGSFSQRCELKGVIQTDKPLYSGLRQAPCVYYETRITEEHEETYYERDSQGREQRRTRTHTRTLRDETRSVPFYVEDSSGRILVEPDGAEWDPETLVDEFQPGGLPQQILQQMVSNTRFVGTRYRERIVPLQKRAYLLGEARDAGGLALRKPEKGGRFLISLKSEEQLAESAKSSAQGFNIGAIVCALLGLGLLIAGLVS